MDKTGEREETKRKKNRKLRREKRAKSFRRGNK